MRLQQAGIAKQKQTVACAVNTVCTRPYPLLFRRRAGLPAGTPCEAHTGLTLLDGHTEWNRP